MYVITGASGHTGRRIARRLLEAGKEVRAVSSEKILLKELIQQGAEPAVGELSDPGFMTGVLEGAKAVYVMVPSKFIVKNYRVHQNAVINSIATAVELNEVQFAITLSSMGAHLDAGAGILQGIYDMEQRFNQIQEMNVLHLRAGYFFENLLGHVEMIKLMGLMGSPIRGDIKLPMVATQDLADEAVKHLLALDFKGSNIQYVLGERDLSHDEVAAILGKAINREELKYITLPYENARKSMMQEWGVSENVAGLMIEYQHSINEGLIQGDAQRNALNTTPTSIEMFAKVFAEAYSV